MHQHLCKYPQLQRINKYNFEIKLTEAETSKQSCGR